MWDYFFKLITELIFVFVVSLNTGHFLAIWTDVPTHLDFPLYRLTAVFVVYTSRVSFLECHGRDLLMTYLIGLMTILSVTICLEFIVVYISAQGSIFNASPRRHLPLVRIESVGQK